MPESKKEYVGDGVYVSTDNYHIIIEANNEFGANRIYIESQVLEAINNYKKRLDDEHAQPE